MSTSTARTSTSARLSAIEATLAAITAHLGMDEPAKTAPARKAVTRKARKTAPAKVETNEFVEWLHETAEARNARKATNKAAATWMREKGLVPNGPAWEAVKAGERNVAKLRKLA